MADLVERLRARTKESPSGCWEWQGAKVRGYGCVRLDGRTQYVHRIGYTAMVGPIPEGLEIDHLCRNPVCWNPEHLEPVTHRENGRRGVAAVVNAERMRAIEKCPAGHPYAGENLYVNPQGKRECRTCHRESVRRYKQKLASINVARQSRRGPKVVTDHHDYGTVDVTEHWHDRQDVTVKPDTIRIKPKGTVHGA